MSDTAVKVVGKREFIVKRHFTGKKNIDEVLTRIAVAKAYEDIKNGLLYKNSGNYLSQDLAKREVI